MIDFPPKVKESISKNEDGTYSIFLNSKLSREDNIKSYYHALRHILGEDFDKANVNIVEQEAHTYT